MDNVLVDFPSGIDRLSEETKKEFEGRLDEVPGIFSLMKPVEGAVEAVRLLSQYFDCYILSTAPWKNPSAWTDKANWVHKYFGIEKDTVFYKRLIISHHKDLNKGDYLIDDRTKNGAGEFQGKLVQFGSERFPDWDTVTEYLVHCAKGMQCLESIEYKKNEPTCLNELTENEVAELKRYKLYDTRGLLLMNDYADKTFCIQRDYDYQFGNISWEQSFMFFSNAEKHIEQDLQIRRDKGTPHYMIDKSYIAIYPFSELQFLNRNERRAMINQLAAQIDD
jgi:5'(3')-deoxyribonucleotidase